MTELTGMACTELTDWVLERGLPAFRGKQIFQWIHQGKDFDEMTNLPLSLRTQLKEISVAQSVRIQTLRISKKDGTAKFLFELMDGNCVEGVLMNYRYGFSLCVSTQVGCKMGCRFCASTLEGCVRNLTAGEMLGEVLCANRYLSETGHSNIPDRKGKEAKKINHVVLMGSGEPLDNYNQVIRFLRLLNEKDGINLSLRNVSLSTCGLVPEMYQFAKEGLPVTLCVSLHAPNDEIRKKIMPIANKYSIDDILKACRYYIEETGRRVIFEYALADGINSGEEHARELSSKLRGLQCHVNLIPLNSVPERHLLGVGEETVQHFLKVLEERHVSATRRREMGDDIEGACGQLRRSSMMKSKTDGEVQQ